MILHNAKIYLCRPDRSVITELNGKQINSVNYERNLKDYNKLTFNVDRYISVDGQNVESNGYNQLKNHLCLYLEGIDYFQLQEPSTVNDGKYEYKMITAYSDEKSLEDKDLKGLLFNKGTTDSLEMLATNNVDELGFAKEYITFCNDKNHELSLLHLILEKAPGWTVGYIDPLIKNQKYSFEAENTNIYAFLIGTVAPIVKCIFYFDTIKREISAHYRENIGLYSNIFIGFRNLLQSVKLSVQEDSIKNVLTVQGDDSLDIRAVNFGSSQIYNLDYFLNTDYFDQKTIDKIKYWFQYRESKRQDYVNLAKNEAEWQVKIDDIYDRVPNDGCNIDQWKTMDKELLEKNLRYFQKLLETLQISVDTRPENEQYDNPDDLQNRKYQPWLDSDGIVDHKKYLDLLFTQENGYGGYYTYLEVKDYIIPNIQTAIENINIPEDQQKDYNKEFETNWNLYGIRELEGKRDGYNKEILEVLKFYAKEWSELTDAEKIELGMTQEYYEVKHKRYLQYKGYLGDESTEGSLLYKLKQLNVEVKTLEKEQQKFQEGMTSLAQDVQLDNNKFGLSHEEYIAINNILIMGDYTNNNILITSIDTAITSFSAKENLYQDGIEKVSEVSQPQYSVETNIDNLLSINEYVNVRDTENKQSWYDKFDVGNFIRLGVRDDYSIKLRLLSFSYNPCTNSSDINVTYTNMVNGRTGRDDFTDLFDDTVSDTKNSISVGTGDAKDSVEYMTNMLNLMTKSQLFGNVISNTFNEIISNSGQIEVMIGDYLKYRTIHVDSIIGTDAQFDTMFSKYINAEFFNTHITWSDIAGFGEMSTDIANIKKALIGTSSTETGFFINLNAENATLDAAWIAELVAGKISVGQLQSGIIDTKKFVISSNVVYDKNGTPALSGKGILIQDGTQTFTDESGQVRIQIGEDASKGYSMYVYDTAGSLIFDATNGLYADGIKNPIIKDSMVASKTDTYTGISAEKLNISSVVSAINIGDTKIDWGSITADGSSLDVKFGQITKSSNDITTTDGTYTLQAYCEGNLQSDSCTFHVKVYCKNAEGTDENITSSLDDYCFVWKRVSTDPISDEEWNSKRVRGKNLTVVGEEKQWSYQCELTWAGRRLAATKSNQMLITKQGNPLVLYHKYA